MALEELAPAYGHWGTRPGYPGSGITRVHTVSTNHRLPNGPRGADSGRLRHFYLNAPGLGMFGLGYPQGQHTITELRAYFFRIEFTR